MVSKYTIIACIKVLLCVFWSFCVVVCVLSFFLVFISGFFI